MTRMSNNLSTTSTRFPIKILTFSIIFTLLTLGAFAFYSFNTVKELQKIIIHNFRAIELSGIIIQLDEILTMSAHMGVFTGDPKWEGRYNYYSPLLVKATNEADLYIPSSEVEETILETEDAAAKLLNMERQAFHFK